MSTILFNWHRNSQRICILQDSQIPPAILVILGYLVSYVTQDLDKAGYWVGVCVCVFLSFCACMCDTRTHHVKSIWWLLIYVNKWVQIFQNFTKYTTSLCTSRLLRGKIYVISGAYILLLIKWWLAFKTSLLLYKIKELCVWYSQCAI